MTRNRLKNVEEEIEIQALREFRDSIDNTLKDYLRGSIDSLMSGMECMDQTDFTTEQKINALTELITKSLEWRYEYEVLLQYAKPPEELRSLGE
jgi:hypothetical protein